MRVSGLGMRMYSVWRFGVHSIGLGFQVRGVGVFRVSGSGFGGSGKGV